VAELLESPRVVFPVNASVLSAFGTLVTPVRIDLARSMVRPLLGDSDDNNADRAGDAGRDRLLDELRAEGRRVLVAAGVDESQIRFRYGVDARYAGQGNEITIWVGENSATDGDVWPATDAQVRQRFDDDYKRIYGLTFPDVAIEAVTWRLSAFAPANPVQPHSTAASVAGQPVGSRSVRFSRTQTAVDTPVYKRTDLASGQSFDGPAIVEERETTAVIRPGWRVTVADDGSLLADRIGAEQGGRR
ncbi:MAG TPA: hydantoinase/oxoprolinase family protein, partial [Ilumatobacteraceae bacterium]|nr:hydantoinase/oxoprolinase family protein [Ilumatobacteraceae bacterium]